jgi:hypothetical protein
MIQTYQQFKASEYASLRAEYPDADVSDIHEMVDGACRRQDWVDATTEAMKSELPSRQQWPHLVSELSPLYIWRRVFHDSPGADARYLASGLILPQIVKG